MSNSALTEKDMKQLAEQKPVALHRMGEYKWTVRQASVVGNQLVGAGRMDIQVGRKEDEIVTIAHCRNWLRKMLGMPQDEVVDMPTVATARPAEFNIIAFPDLRHSATYLPRIPQVDIFAAENGGRVKLESVLRLLCWFPSTMASIQYYMMGPDDGVHVLKAMTEEELGKWFDDVKVPFRVSDDLLHSTTFLRCLAYCIYLSMLKRVDNLAAFRQFMERRLTAFFHCIGLEGASMTAERIFVVLPIDQLFALSQRISFFPKLISTLFRGILCSTNPEALHLRDIAKDNSMTPYSFIVAFMTTPVPTKLHLQYKVLAEAARWLGTQAALVADYGDLWPYFKLLEPQSSRTSSKNFPVLSEAAFAWMIATSNQETIAAMRGIPNNPIYVGMATQRVRQEYLAEAGAGVEGLFANLRDLRCELNLNWDIVAESLRDGMDIFVHENPINVPGPSSRR